MAFDLGAIRARMGLDTGGWVSNLKSAETAAEIFGSNVTQFINNPLLGTVNILKKTVTGFAGLVRETADYNRQVQQWSERTGASTELLSALAFAARKVGMELGDVGDMMAEVAVKARDSLGSEDLAATFNKLGVSVTDNKGNLRSAQAIFLDMAEGLSKVQNQTERVAIVDELLSDAGKRMLPIISQKKDELEKLIKTAEKYGQVVRSDAIESSTALANSIDNMSYAFEGLKKSGATAFIQGFADVTGDADRAVLDLTNTIKGPLTSALHLAGEKTAEIIQSDYWREFKDGLLTFTDILMDTNSSLENLNPKKSDEIPILYAHENERTLLEQSVEYIVTKLWYGHLEITPEQARQRAINYRDERNSARRLAAQQGSMGG